MTNDRELAHEFVNKVEETLSRVWLKAVEHFDGLHEAIDKVADEREAKSDSGAPAFEQVLDDIASFEEAQRGPGYVSAYRQEYARGLAAKYETMMRKYWEEVVPGEFKAAKATKATPSSDGSELFNKLRKYAQENGLI